MADRDKFQGDMSRNEVEIDLNKFMEMVTENQQLKQKIWELEHDDKKNPFQKVAGPMIYRTLFPGSLGSYVQGAHVALERCRMGSETKPFQKNQPRYFLRVPVQGSGFVCARGPMWTLSGTDRAPR